VKRELLRLVLAVVLVDALFIAGYYLFYLQLASSSAPKIGYTMAWTAVTLFIVLRALTRIRALRRRGRRTATGDRGHSGSPRG
jgi:hypothetical protein